MKNARDFVTPEARYAEQADAMSGVRGTAAADMVVYPLNGLGQVSEVAWYQRPMIVLPVGIALGVGIGWSIWGWFMPRMTKNLKRKIARGQED